MMKDISLAAISLSAISLAAVLCATGAQAAPVSATASVTVSNFHYTLIDLDTSDNIAPSIHFLPTASYPHLPPGSSVNLRAAVEPDGEKPIVTSEIFSGDKVLDVSRAGSIMGLVNTSTTITAGGGESGIQGSALTTQGTAEIPIGSAFRGISSFSTDASIYGSNRFTLSAHTQLVFSFDLTASASVFANANQQAGVDIEVGVGLSYTDALGRSHRSPVSRKINLDSNWSSAQSINETVYYNMSNISANDLAGGSWMGSRVRGYAFAAPVPEPETYAMLLAGLGLLGCVAKRRRA